MPQGRSQQNSPKGFSRFSPSFNFPLRPLASCELVFEEVIFILQVRIGINVPSITPWVKREQPSHPKAAFLSLQTPGGEGRIWPRWKCIPELSPHTSGAPTGCLPPCWALGTQRPAGHPSLSPAGRESHLPAPGDRAEDQSGQRERPAKHSTWAWGFWGGQGSPGLGGEWQLTKDEHAAPVDHG